MAKYRKMLTLTEEDMKELKSKGMIKIGELILCEMEE